MLLNTNVKVGYTVNNTADRLKLHLDGRKPMVAFVCVHNSCRSQIAEALGKHFAANVFESYSAGTHTKDRINPDAVRIIKDKYSIDMELTQRPKLIDYIPEVDVIITMGCNVVCPVLPYDHMEDWSLDDPSGKSDEEFLIVVAEIDRKVKELVHRIAK